MTRKLFRLLLYCVMSWALLWSPAHSQSNTAFEDGIFSDENLLVLEVHLKKIPMDTAIEAYQHRGGFFLPLQALAEIVNFKIDVDAETGQASGWFHSEDNTFLLDLSRQELVIGGEKRKLNTSKVHPYFGDIFVDASLIEEWIGIKAVVKMSQLIVVLSSQKKLPIEKALLRKELQERLNKLTKKTKKNNYPVIRQPYKLMPSLPFIDFSMAQTLNRSGGVINRNNSYSAISLTDLGFMNAKTAVSGSAKDENKISNVSFSLERRSYDTKLFDILPASRLIVGDISPVRSPHLNYQGTGRGAYITNRDLDIPIQFDKTDFVGESHPNWDIELYRNGLLIDTLTVGDDLKYEFRDIPILYGNNNFRLIFYGPQGQVEYKVYNYNIATNTLQAGDLYYEFSFDQQTRKVFEVIKPDSEPPEDYRYVGSVHLGLNSNFTLQSIFTHLPQSSAEGTYELNRGTQYQSFILAGNLGKVFTQSKYVRNMDHKGWLSEYSINTRLFDISVRSTLIAYRNLVTPAKNSEEELNGKHLSYLFDGQVGPISYAIDSAYESFKDNTSADNSTLTLSTNVKGFNLNTSMTYNSDKTAEGVTTREVTGNVLTSQRYLDYSISTAHTWQLQPKADILTSTISTQRLIGEDSSISVDFGRSWTDQMTTSYGLSFSTALKRMLFSAGVSGDNEENYIFSSQFSFSFGYDPKENHLVFQKQPIASAGIVSANVFNDENSNGIRDAGEEVFSGTSFKGSGIVYDSLQENKPTLLSSVPTYVGSDLSIAEGGIDDPFLAPAAEGYNIIAHPGTITRVDFPLVYMTEIDGTVRIAKKDQEKGALFPKIILKNKNNPDDVREINGEFDGFYMISRVKEGEYTVELAEDTYKRYGLKKSPIVEVSVQKGSDFISGIDIIIDSTKTSEGGKEKDYQKFIGPKPLNSSPTPVVFENEDSASANPPIEESEEIQGPPVAIVKPIEIKEQPNAVDGTKEEGAILHPQTLDLNGALPPILPPKITDPLRMIGPRPVTIIKKSTASLRPVHTRNNKRSLYRSNGASPLNAIVRSVEKTSLLSHAKGFKDVYPEGVSNLIETHKKKAIALENSALKRRAARVGPHIWIGPPAATQQNLKEIPLPPLPATPIMPPKDKKHSIQAPALYEKPYETETQPTEDIRPIEEKPLQMIGPMQKTKEESSYYTPETPSAIALQHIEESPLFNKGHKMNLLYYKQNPAALPNTDLEPLY